MGTLKVTMTVKMEVIPIFRQHPRGRPRAKPKGTMHVQPNFRRRKRKKKQSKRWLKEQRRLLEKNQKKKKQKQPAKKPERLKKLRIQRI